MRALVLLVGFVLLHFCGCDDQVVEEFDCSSYFSRVLTKRHLGSSIIKVRFIAFLTFNLAFKTGNKGNSVFVTFPLLL